MCMKPYHSEISKQQESREDPKSFNNFFFFYKTLGIRLALTCPRENLETSSQNYDGERVQPRITYSSY